MNDRIEQFWSAMAVLTFSEMLEVAETFRDAWEATTDFEASDLQDWSFLLNSAREIAESSEEDEAA